MEEMMGKRITDPSTSLTECLAEWNELLTIMPISVKTAIPLTLWNRDLLYALDMPVVDIPVVELAWLFDIPLWAVDGIPFQVTPNQVWEHPDRFAAQYALTLDADLAWPIHIIRHGLRWTILDGVHRLLKADMLGHQMIGAMPLTPADYASLVYPPGFGAGKCRVPLHH